MLRDDRGVALRQIGALFRAGSFAGMTDGQLLDQFAARRGEPGELAFAALVERHGPMVLRVCRRVLKDRDAAEDAFQATFLALARGAGGIRSRESVASWLHGAALRVSASARSAGARRREHERRWAARRPTAGDEPGHPGDDLGAAVHEEVGRLPAPYRAAVVLCDLQGLSHDEAARHLGLPIGTIKSRVARGRERLRARLARRGLAPTLGAVGVALARESGAAVRQGLAEDAVRLAVGWLTGRGAAWALASTVERLAHLHQRSLLMARLRTMAMGLATVGALAAGANLLAHQGRGTTPRAEAAPRADPPAGEAYGTIVKTYNVSDLVGSFGPDPGPRDRIADIGPLVDLLAASVAPGTWKYLFETNHLAPGADPRSNAQVGSIVIFQNHSLIVRHFPEVHTQFGERLHQIRRVVEAIQGRQAPTARGRAEPTTLDAPTRPAGVGDEPQLQPPSAANPPTPDAQPDAEPSAVRPARSVGRPSSPPDAQPDAEPSAVPPPGEAPPPPAAIAEPTLTPSPAAAVPPTPQPLPAPAPRRPTPAPAPVAPPTPAMLPTPAPSRAPFSLSARAPASALPPTPASAPSEGPTSPSPAPAARPAPDAAPTLPEPTPVISGPSREAETERRLRALEQKIDRILKALDMPKSERVTPPPTATPAPPTPS